MGWVSATRSLLNKLYFYVRSNIGTDKISKIAFPKSQKCQSSYKMLKIRGKTTFLSLIYIMTVFLVCIYFKNQKSYDYDPIAVFIQERNNDDFNWVPLHISELMSGEMIRLPQNDDRIIKYIWDAKLLQPPSKEKYYMLDHPNANPSLGQGQFIQNVLDNMTNGFFVEAAALDGEALSNTLFLEKQFGWKGLLIETDPHNYVALKRKQRKAWTSNTCLATQPYPHRGDFLLTEAMAEFHPQSPDGKRLNVQCLPLFSLLSALNVTTVDYFSLDVQGKELEVLMTIPFDKVFFKTLSVFVHIADQSFPLVEFMHSNGYDMFREVSSTESNDFIFVHKSLSPEM